MSHDTWTVFCKKMIYLAYQAQERVRARHQDREEPGDDHRLEMDWVTVDDDDGIGEDDVEQGATMYAKVAEQKAQKDTLSAVEVEVPVQSTGANGSDSVSLGDGDLRGGAQVSSAMENDQMDCVDADEACVDQEAPCVGNCEDATATDGDERAVPELRFDVSNESNQCLDWLHRGNREPLASMPLYVLSLIHI